MHFTLALIVCRRLRISQCLYAGLPKEESIVATPREEWGAATICKFLL
jgi:hypothetical protein